MNQEALRDTVTHLKPKRSLSFIQPLDVDDGGQRSVRKSSENPTSGITSDRL